MGYFISRLIYKLILKLFFKFEVIDRENIPKEGPFIMVANHVSYADPAVMGVACNTLPLRFLAKKELFHNPVLGAWCRAVGCIFIERESTSSAPLKNILKVLNARGAVGIFPEGKRSPDGELQKAKLGIGVIAAKSRAPIIPMYIFGTRKAMPKGQSIPRPCKVKARIGKPVDVSGHKSINDKKKAYEFIGSKIMEGIAELKDV